MRSAFSMVSQGLALLLVLLLPACIEPYSPEIPAAKRSFLVVDGFINSVGVTTIRLSRTFAVTSLPKVPNETKAVVYIEDTAGARFPLAEGATGTYTSAYLNLILGRTYRLRIATPAGVLYASDFVPAKTTPPIDAVDWRTDNAGLGIYISAHDDTNATQYYRWEYEETWEIIPPFSPSIEFVNNVLRPIRVLYPDRCWGNERAAAIQLTTTKALSKDVVSGFALRRLPRSTDRLYRRYSILVQQHALTKDEYSYWEQLRKNTESLGTLFDPQPSQLSGNVHCLSNEDELAFGFVGAHSLAQKRIFIERSQLPFDWPFVSGYEACVPPDTAKGNVIPLLRTGFVLPVSEVRGGITVATLDCIDCRRRGSSNRPAFW
ncbi:hypothetical protein ACVWYF_001596 [Hymenobacter sp. UYAg731]